MFIKEEITRNVSQQVGKLNRAHGAKVMKSHFEVVKNQKSETFRSIANAVNRFAKSQCVTIPFKGFISAHKTIVPRVSDI